MKVSVCIAAHNKPRHLRKVLESIEQQRPPFLYEVIVADDGSDGGVISRVCEEFPIVQCIRINRASIFRNPCVARNVAYRAARGEFIIAQSDDVVHVTNDSIRELAVQASRRPDAFMIATVLGCGPDGHPWSVYTGAERQLPYFFLGIVRRSHLYAAGGNDEDFRDVIGYEDQWFGDCLTKGLELQAVYLASVVGHHRYHPRSDTDSQAAEARAVYEGKCAEAARTRTWVSSGGAWELSC